MRLWVVFEDHGGSLVERTCVSAATARQAVDRARETGRLDARRCATAVAAGNMHSFGPTYAAAPRVAV